MSQIRRRTFVSVNVRGRDVASFRQGKPSARLLQIFACLRVMKYVWGEIFEICNPPVWRLMIITPVVLLLIFLLLLTSFGSASLASLISFAVPIAHRAEFSPLALRGMPFSISAGVGFIALFWRGRAQMDLCGSVPPKISAQWHVARPRGTRNSDGPLCGQS